MKKIFYLHGLEGNLSEEKLKVLQQFGEVWGDDIDYRKPQILKELLQKAIDFKADIIIGSSMGGYIGLMISQVLNVRSLLFNPALPYRTIQPDIEGVEIPKNKTSESIFVLGKLDMVIKFKDNIKFINENLMYLNPKIEEVENLEHRIDIETFKRVMNNYLKD